MFFPLIYSCSGAGPICWTDRLCELLEPPTLHGTEGKCWIHVSAFILLYVWICEDDGDSDKRLHMGERSPLWDYLRLKLNIIGMQLNIRLVEFDGTHSEGKRKAFHVLYKSATELCWNVCSEHDFNFIIFSFKAWMAAFKDKYMAGEECADKWRRKWWW